MFHAGRETGFRRDEQAELARFFDRSHPAQQLRGVAVCAAVSPYRATRNQVRAMVGADRFVEVFVDTPLDVCESRDSKGMYAKARSGQIVGFTGIDDPYEAPVEAEVRLTTTNHTVSENAHAVLETLIARGYVRGARD